MKRSLVAAFAAVLALPLALCGCGIDTFVYLYPVTQLLNSPSTTDPSYNYFQFKTSDSDNYDAYGSDGYFKGFEVYYRIYNSTSTRSSDVSAIYTYNENNPTTALTKLVGTYYYHRMVHSGRLTSIPLIPGDSSNRTVSIRLFDQNNYVAYFSLDGSTNGSGSIGIPERTHNSGTTFETFVFKNIDTSDDDVSYTSSSGTTTWYVQAYAVAYGYDESYKPYYSEVFSLGYVTVTE